MFAQRYSAEVLHMIGDRLREVRGRQSRDKFAKMLGIHPQTLRRYEKGERSPCAGFLSMFCKRLKIDANWLLSTHKEHARVPGEIAPSEHRLAEILARELSKERDINQEIVAENKDLLKENCDLQIQLVKVKAQLAPEEKETIQPLI